MILFKKPKTKSKFPVKIKLKKVINYNPTINERDNLATIDLLEYQGVFIIPTLNKVTVPRTNYIENIIKNCRLVDSTFFADSTSIPRPIKKTIDNKVIKESWSKAKSIFKGYVVDHPNTLKKWFEEDWGNSNIEKIVKDEFDRNKVKEFLQSIYIPLRETYKNYAGTSFVNNVPAVGSNSITDLLISSGALDYKLLKLADIGVDFIATNVGQKPPDPQWRHLNPDRLLVRDEFMQIFVRLAASKYLKTKLFLTHTDAVKQLFKDGLLKYMKTFDSNDFRVNKLYNESWDMVFKYYLKSVKTLYNSYSGKHSKPADVRFMWWDEFMKLISDSGIVSDLFGSREVGIIFNLSMMTQVNETSSDRHFHMSFDEFIEAIARVADKCNLLLVSSTYFGVDLAAQASKPPETAKNLERRGTLVPDPSNKGIFDPSTIMKSKMAGAIEEDTEESKILDETENNLEDNENNDEEIKEKSNSSNSNVNSSSLNASNSNPSQSNSKELGIYYYFSSNWYFRLKII